MFRLLKNFYNDETGIETMEVALFAGFIALVFAAFGPFIRTALETIFTNVQSRLEDAATGG